MRVCDRESVAWRGVAREKNLSVVIGLRTI